MPICAPTMRSEYYLVGDRPDEKVGVEVLAASELSVSTARARAQLERAMDSLPVPVAPLRELLVGLLEPLSLRKVAAARASDRGHAREICASLRVFAEASISLLARARGAEEACCDGSPGSDAKCPDCVAKRLRWTTKWAMHPPMFRRVEDDDGLTHPELPVAAKPFYFDSDDKDARDVELCTICLIRDVDIVEASKCLGLLVQLLLEGDTLRALAAVAADAIDAPFGSPSGLRWRLEPLDDALLAPLGETCANARASFRALGERVGIGKHGVRRDGWGYPPTASGMSNVLLFVEAAEHIVVADPAAAEHLPDSAGCGSSGSSGGGDAVADAVTRLRWQLVRMCRGLRLFAEAAQKAVFKLRAHGWQTKLWDDLDHLKASVVWAGHSQVYRRRAEWLPRALTPEVVASIDEAATTCVASLMRALEFVALATECRVWGDAEAADFAVNDDAWKRPLFVGLATLPFLSADYDVVAREFAYSIVGAGERNAQLRAAATPFLLRAAQVLQLLSKHDKLCKHALMVIASEVSQEGNCHWRLPVDDKARARFRAVVDELKEQGVKCLRFEVWAKLVSDLEPAFSSTLQEASVTQSVLAERAAKHR